MQGPDVPLQLYYRGFERTIIDAFYLLDDNVAVRLIFARPSFVQTSGKLWSLTLSRRDARKSFRISFNGQQTSGSPLSGREVLTRHD
jgi:hypothetical protein